MKRLYLSLIPLILAAGSLEAAALPVVKDAPNNTNIEVKSGHSAAEVFRHFSSECEGVGKVLFLGTLKHGRFLRLTLLSPKEAASYIETDGDGKYPWLLACDSRERFLVEKEHRYGTGRASFRFHKGRALEGIDYVDSRPAGAAVALDAVGDDAFAEKMASELSGHGMDFIATNQGTRFEGRIESRKGACDTVSIRRFPSGTATGTTQGFKVCSGQVYPLGGPLTMSAAR